MADKSVDQGLPNTPANAWPVSVTNFPSNHTHLGQLPSNLVTIRTFTNRNELIRIFPDGTRDAFVFPTNKVLIATDFKFLYTNAAPNTSIDLILEIPNINLGVEEIIVNISTSDSNGKGGGTTSLTSGIAISRNFSFDSNAYGVVDLQGYLIDFS